MFLTDEERRIVHKLIDRFVDMILDELEEYEGEDDGMEKCK
jgi:hypothetical protein